MAKRERRTPVDKLLGYIWVRDTGVAEDEIPLIAKLVASLKKEQIEASSHLAVPFIHALAHYADTPRALHVLTVMRDNPLCSTYFENRAYPDGYGNTVLANLCSRAHYSLANNPVRRLVEELGGRPTPSDGRTGVVKDYLK
jgi:hypothetical protein